MFTVNQTGAGPHCDSRREGREARPTSRRRAIQEALGLLEEDGTTLWADDAGQPGYVVLSDGTCVAEGEA